MHLSHTHLFLHYTPNRNIIIILLSFKIKKLRHGVVRYLAQGHTAMKWWYLERSQKV